MTDMTVTNQTAEALWFGPLRLPAGVNSTLVVDITTNESLYLTDDSVAEALNNYYAAGKILVSNPPTPFPRPTGTPQLLHGDGSPEGTLFAPQGSAYMRRDNTGATASLYVKTSGAWLATGWQALSTANIAVPTGVIQAFGGTTAPTDWLLCDGTAVSRTLYSALFGIINVTFGSGDGSTTFNLPDLRGRVPVGYAASGGHPDVSALGNNEGSVLANRRPKHPHTNGLTLPNHGHSVSDPGHSHSVSDPGHYHQLFGAGNDSTYARSGSGYGDSGSTDGQVTDVGTGISIYGNTTGLSVGNPTSNPAINGTIGAAGTANDAPAYIVLNYIIKT